MTVEPVESPSYPLPAESGEGKRVVFSESQQRVWLVREDGKVQRTYLVSGSLTDNLDPGTYSVYSRSKRAWGIDDSGTMKWFVRFTTGDTGAAIGFHDIPIADGQPSPVVVAARHSAVARLHPSEGARREGDVEVRSARDHGRRHRLTHLILCKSVAPRPPRQQTRRDSGAPTRLGRASGASTQDGSAAGRRRRLRFRLRDGAEPAGFSAESVLER